LGLTFSLLLPPKNLSTKVEKLFHQISNQLCLATGLFGKVKLVYSQRTQEHYALKCVSKAKVWHFWHLLVSLLYCSSRTEVVFSFWCEVVLSSISQIPAIQTCMVDLTGNKNARGGALEK
jgi:hypothetical protein